MTENQRVAGSSFGRIVLGTAIVVLIAGTPSFLMPTASAGSAGYLHIIGPQAMDGASKDAAHLNWTVISSVVSADLKGDAQADRESSAPSVSEMSASHTVTPPREPASGQASGKMTVAPSASASSVSTAREASSGMATGKRMHKPFTITKEIDKASPLLMKACASGQHFQEVDVDLSTGVRYTLTDVMISSDEKATGGDKPMETISFTYQKIEMK
jgi:Type VI secretion system effector, Hcp